MTAALGQANVLTLQGALGHYQLEDYLGGGQTAAVYRARIIKSQITERVGQTVAVKLMLPGLEQATQRRFFEEADTLIQLRSQLKHPDLALFTAAFANAQLIPDVLDQVKDSPHAFIVMTLASGQPLDELLRHGWQSLTEPEMLTIFYQILTVLAALHEGLQRSYLDFQPKNVFWDAAQGSVTIVDWNLLSSPGQAEIRHDLTSVARLFYRLVVGCAPPGNTPATLARPQRWRDISRPMRSLLLEWLAPNSNAHLSARTMCAHLDKMLQLWMQSGDQLLIQATATAAQMERLAPADQQLASLHHLQILVDLAERRGFSSYMGVVAQGVRTKLHEHEEQFSWNTRARTFLNAGDSRTAEALLLDAIDHVSLPAEQLAAWRWLAVARAPQADMAGYRTVAEPLTVLLTEVAAAEQWSPYDWAARVAALQALTWPGTAPLATEWQAYSGLQRLFAVEELALQQAAPDAIATLIQTGEEAVAALDDLPGSQEEHSYAASTWAWLGNGDAAVGRQTVTARLAALHQRARTLAALDEQLGADLLPQRAAELVRTSAGDPYLVAALLPRCRAWLVDANNDAGVELLLNAVLDIARTSDQIRQAHLLASKLRQLDEAAFWVESLCIASQNAGRAMVASRLTPSVSQAAEAPDVDQTTALDSEHAQPASTEDFPLAGQTVAAPTEVSLQPEQIQQILLQTVTHMQRMAEVLADVPDRSRRLKPLLVKMAEASIASQQHRHTVAALLTDLAPDVLQRQQALLQLTQRDQEIQRKIEELTQQQVRLERQVSESLARKQKLEEEYASRHQVLEDKYTTRQQALDRQRTADSEDWERRFKAKQQEVESTYEARQQNWTTRIQQLEQQRNVISEEIQGLRQERQNLSTERNKLEAEVRAQRRELSELQTEQGKIYNDMERVRQEIVVAQRKAASLATHQDHTPNVRPVTPARPARQLSNSQNWSLSALMEQLDTVSKSDETSSTQMMIELSKQNQATAESAWRKFEDKIAFNEFRQGLQMLSALYWHTYIQVGIVEFAKTRLQNQAQWEALDDAQQVIAQKYQQSYDTIVQRLQDKQNPASRR